MPANGCVKSTHPSDTDLERYCLGIIQEGPELDALEEHLLICGECVDRALASDAMLMGFGLHWSSAVLVCGRSVAARPPNDPVALDRRTNRTQTVSRRGFAVTWGRYCARRGAVVVLKSVMVFLPRLRFGAERLAEIRPIVQSRGLARAVARYSLPPRFDRLV